MTVKSPWQQQAEATVGTTAECVRNYISREDVKEQLIDVLYDLAYLVGGGTYNGLRFGGSLTFVEILNECVAEATDGEIKMQLLSD